MVDEIEGKRAVSDVDGDTEEQNGDVGGEDEAAIEARRQYQAGWWQRNGVSKRQERRERYQNDPVYRQECVERAEAYRKRRVDEGRTHREAQGRQLTIQLGDERLPAFTATFLAKELGRTLQAINNWQSRGMLPETPLHSDGGARLYTEAMIEVVKASLDLCPHRRVQVGDMDFHSRIEKGWRKLGVYRKKNRHVA